MGLRLTTRGLGGPAGGLITSGFGSVAVVLARIIRGGRSAASRAAKDLTESFKISTMLIQSNGKELVSPIFNSITATFSTDDETVIKAKAKKISYHKPKPPKINVKSILVRNRKNERN